MFKLVAVVEGEAFGAYLDARPGSPSHGQTVTTRLAKGTQVLAPKGVCNGFQSVSPGVTQYLYCFDQEWRPGMAGTSVSPLDPVAAIAWPLPVNPSDPAQISANDECTGGDGCPGRRRSRRVLFPRSSCPVRSVSCSRGVRLGGSWPKPCGGRVSLDG